jgi:hypothetical protein
MGNKATSEVVSTAAPAVVTSTVPTSFVYEDLIFHIKDIQQQIVEITKFLDDRWNNGKKKRNELKLRSLIFLDPYGNLIGNKYMDHEMIDTILRKFKKDYVPKYLQKWIKIGTISKDVISPSSDCELKSNVCALEDGHQFVTYGEVVVWIGNYDFSSAHKIVFRVLVTDKMEKIKMHLKERQHFSNIELKSIIINQNTPPNSESWNEGNILKLEDTIMSCQLYQENCIIMAKLTQANVGFTFLLLTLHDFVCFYRLMMPKIPQPFL